MRRGQAALEFLTTYGWAFLIILVMIGTISYFGILNPAKLLPSRCMTGSELNCGDYRIRSDGTVELQLTQSMGKTIYLESFNCTWEGTEDNIDMTPQTWPPRDTVTFACAVGIPAGLEGEKTKVYFDIVYRKSVTGFLHTVSGELYTEVQ